MLGIAETKNFASTRVVLLERCRLADKVTSPRVSVREHNSVREHDSEGYLVLSKEEEHYQVAQGDIWWSSLGSPSPTAQTKLGALASSRLKSVHVAN